ncbi:MAG: hypothetical protein OEW64_08120 [Gammaproteobacteria bacterium]|nr:hypothetical protein [Gammaproteobacteria bacterium]MDH5304050.1 hypothetical protein [Gammaproteobacteria bacterium]MDH5323411.1 hypothetical protein [Gammaproteobacteria bacterium]
MSDVADRGITVTELAPIDQPVDLSRETTAAFVGRALRGPINEPVLVKSFGEFRRRFGDSWSRSSLGPAAQQFFEHGGRQLYIVRVANGARGAMLCLPASGSALVLRAVEPGSTELIRAAVDYDGIDAGNEELFNLTLQRLDPASGLVVDQELFPAVSYLDSSTQFVVDMLLTSTLARVESPLPTHRPEPTAGAHTAFNSSYVVHTQAGADGQELSDYDLVGSRKLETGLFALAGVADLDLLYLPPPGKRRDLGPTAVLAAERFCRERGAMLLLDPLQDWHSAADAMTGVRALGYSSTNLLSYFPRMLERQESGRQHRAVGGALAGLLCKLDRKYGAWQQLDQRDLGFSRSLQPAVDVDASDESALIRAGLNVIANGPTGAAQLRGSVTMARGSSRQLVDLRARRLCLRVIHAVDAATRWAVFAGDDMELARRIRAQVTACLASFVAMGAFASDRFVVECDAGVRKRAGSAGQQFAIFLTFQPLGATEPVAFTIHQTVAGSRVASTAFAPA